MNGLIWDAYQQNRIAKAEAASERARDKVESVRSEINTLNRRLNSLTLCCQALWELLRDNTSLTDEDLRAKIREVDARDGQLDQQIGAQQTACPICGRQANTRRKTCVFCGAELNKPHIFE